MFELAEGVIEVRVGPHNDHHPGVARSRHHDGHLSLMLTKVKFFFLNHTSGHHTSPRCTPTTRHQRLATSMLILALIVISESEAVRGAQQATQIARDARGRLSHDEVARWERGENDDQQPQRQNELGQLQLLLDRLIPAIWGASEPTEAEIQSQHTNNEPQETQTLAQPAKSEQANQYAGGDLAQTKKKPGKGQTAAATQNHHKPPAAPQFDDPTTGKGQFLPTASATGQQRKQANAANQIEPSSKNKKIRPQVVVARAPYDNFIYHSVAPSIISSGGAHEPPPPSPAPIQLTANKLLPLGAEHEHHTSRRHYSPPPHSPPADLVLQGDESSAGAQVGVLPSPLPAANQDPIRQLVSFQANNLYYPPSEQEQHNTQHYSGGHIANLPQLTSTGYNNSGNHFQSAWPPASDWPLTISHAQAVNLKPAQQQPSYALNGPQQVTVPHQVHHQAYLADGAHWPPLPAPMGAANSHYQMVAPVNGHSQTQQWPMSQQPAVHLQQQQQLPVGSGGSGWLASLLGAPSVGQQQQQQQQQQATSSSTIDRVGGHSGALAGLLAFLAQNKATLSNLVQLMPLVAQTISTLPRVFAASSSSSSSAVALNGKFAPSPLATTRRPTGNNNNQFEGSASASGQSKVANKVQASGQFNDQQQQQSMRLGNKQASGGQNNDADRRQSQSANAADESQSAANGNTRALISELVRRVSQVAAAAASANKQQPPVVSNNNRQPAVGATDQLLKHMLASVASQYLRQSMRPSSAPSSDSAVSHLERPNGFAAALMDLAQAAPSGGGASQLAASSLGPMLMSLASRHH